MSEECPGCGGQVADATHEFVDETTGTTIEMYACPACGETWERER